MKLQNTFSKKPWITAFFPRGTVVEFDTMVESEFGSAGVGTVQTTTVTNHDNTVLSLHDVVLTKGEFFNKEEIGKYNISSSYVTKIVKRGEGEVTHAHPYPTDRWHYSENKHRVHRYEVTALFSQLASRLAILDKFTLTLNLDAMRDHFLSTHLNRWTGYSAKMVKKWFMRNYNRFLMSNRDIEIAEYFSNVTDSFNFEDDMDMMDDRRQRYQSNTPQSVFACFEELLNRQFRDREWVVLTKELTEKHLKYGLPVYQITISPKARDVVHIFTDKEDTAQLFQSVLQSLHSEYVDVIQIESRKAVQEDLAAFEYSEEKNATAINGLYSAMSYLHYLLTNYDPNYAEGDDVNEADMGFDDPIFDDWSDIT